MNVCLDYGYSHLTDIELEEVLAKELKYMRALEELNGSSFTLMRTEHNVRQLKLEKERRNGTD